MLSTFTRALKASDLPPGTKKAMDINGKPVLLCHSADRFYAVSNICSHADEKLECGRLFRTSIGCPIHGARFDLATGRAIGAPATKPIAIYPVRIDDDWIEVQA